MCRRVIYLISCIVVLSLVGDVAAVDVIWTDASGDHLWSTPENWQGGILPTAGDKAVIAGLPGPTIASDVVARAVAIAKDGPVGALTVDGGTLTMSGDMNVGRDADGNGTLNMISGDMIPRRFRVGYYGSGTVNMIGGTITATGYLTIGDKSSAIGHVNLDGGIITTAAFTMRANDGAVGTMDIRGGMLMIDGDKRTKILEYMQNGWITAYGGNSALQLDYNGTNDKTTLRASPFFLNPNPPDGSSLGAGVSEVVLQWSLPEPNLPTGVVTCDVYFGTNPSVEANPKVVTRQAVESVSVTVVPDTVYYWALDVYDSSISTTQPLVLSPRFTFNTMNLAPIVDAGADVVTWLKEGVRIGNLDGTVTDDGAKMPYTLQWTVVSEPNEGTVIIETATAEDTSITISAVGQYVLQLEAFDGEYTSSDTVTINVYNDSCEAAQSLPDYVPLAGDLNGDCKVDDDDLALLQANWLKDNSLTEEWFKLE